MAEPCPRCHGARWTCEAHPDRPWPHGACPGPGEPCGICNTGNPPDLGDDWISLVKPLTLCDLPVRLDATLCAPDELWIEGPTGDAVRVWPEPAKDPADA